MEELDEESKAEISLKKVEGTDDEDEKLLASIGTSSDEDDCTT